MTYKSSQDLFTQAEDQLQNARGALNAGQYGEAEKLAYHASEIIAAGYLAKLDNVPVESSEKNFQSFIDKVWDRGTTPEATQEIRGVVGDIIVLREVYEPKLQSETTKTDAEMIFKGVTSLFGIARSVHT